MSANHFILLSCKNHLPPTPIVLSFSPWRKEDDTQLRPFPPRNFTCFIHRLCSSSNCLRRPDRPLTCVFCNDLLNCYNRFTWRFLGVFFALRYTQGQSLSGFDSPFLYANAFCCFCGLQSKQKARHVMTGREIMIFFTFIGPCLNVQNQFLRFSIQTRSYNQFV